jgi:hypothetical protein
MLRLWIAVLVIVWAVGPLAAQEQGQVAAPPKQLPEIKPPDPEMFKSLLDLLQKAGPGSPLMTPLLKAMEEFLQKGAPGPQDRQKWEELSQQMEKLAREHFSPENPQNRQQYLDLIEKLKGSVKGLEDPGPAGKAEK